MRGGVGRVERVLLVVTLVFAAFAAVLELSGLQSAWLTERLPAFTLLVLSSLVVNVLLSGERIDRAIERYGDRLEQLNDSYELLSNKDKIVDDLGNLWRDREPAIRSLLERLTALDRGGRSSHEDLVSELALASESLLQGKLEGRGQRYAWDGTIVAIDATRQTFIYHPSEVLAGRAVLPRFSDNYAEILRRKNSDGELIVTSKRTSEQMLGLVRDEGWTAHRYSKLYARLLQRLDVIVVFESHLSIVHQLPVGLHEKHSS